MSEHESVPALFRALVWKEWREWRGAFALYTAVHMCVVLYELLALWDPADPMRLYVVWQMIWGVFLPVLLAVPTVCQEATRNTLSFTQALPCSLGKIGWFRLGGATTVLIVPPLLGALLLVGVLNTFGEFQFAKQLAARPGLLPDFWQGLMLLGTEQLGLLLVVAIVGAKVRSAAQVGAWGAVITAAHFILRAVCFNPTTNSLRWYLIVFPSMLMNPEFLSGRQPPGSEIPRAAVIWQPLTIHVLILLALAVWFTRRYGRGTRSTGGGLESSWFGIRCVPQSMARPTSPLATLIWINLRQAFPLILAGWLMLAPILYLLSSSSQGLTILLERSLCFIGGFWPAIVGSGIFATELRSNLGQFWRSRPISVRSWFWVKYFVGLMMVFVALDLLPIVFGVSIYGIYSVIAPPGEIWNWKIFGVYLACYPVIHAASYTLAVLGVCWIRKPIMSVALTVTILLAISGSLHNSERFKRFDLSEIAASLEVLAYTNRDPWQIVGREFAIAWGTIAVLTGVGAWGASRAARRNDVKPLAESLIALIGYRRGKNAVAERA